MRIKGILRNSGLFFSMELLTMRAMLVGSVIGLLISCTGNKKQMSFEGDDLKDANKIISIRPQQNDMAIFLIKLKQPSLLEQLKTDKLKNVIDKDLSSSIENEQQQTILQLKDIAPKVAVLYRYRMVLNALTIAVSGSDIEKIKGISSVASVEKAGNFYRPQAFRTFAEKTTNDSLLKTLKDQNSVTFIGAKSAWSQSLRGQNMRVGVIDSGVDYTHSMLGGRGSENDYESIDPDEATPMFPNKKVVAGYDFVGSDFDAGSDFVENRIPKPDVNPIDQDGHGTHVAGIIAGIGDGIYTYDGVAPDALIYALKVFGKKGVTHDEVVIAALEYSADPNGDGNLDDHLDVVNLSISAAYGTSHALYNLAVKNLTYGGTVVVVAAGNEGDRPFIVGSPGTGEEALSVAASIDNMERNWKMPAVEFIIPEQPPIVVKAVESSVSRPIADLEELKQKLVYLGLNNTNLSEEQKSLLKSNIALVHRGQNTFYDKMKRAEDSGAAGIIIINDRLGEPFVMEGEGAIGIPAIMISKSVGATLLEEMKKSDVIVNFKTNKTIERPEVIDTITDFSSRGPRSEDSLIKPEITAPGYNILSAAMGKGFQSVALSGTSMSAPHITGTMVLLKQYFTELSVAELKSVVMGTSKTLVDKSKKVYPISRMGAGRVQIEKALNATLASEPASLSLGNLRLDQIKILEKKIKIKNLKPEPISLTVSFEGHTGLSMDSFDWEAPPHSERDLNFQLKLNQNKIAASIEEVDGFIKFSRGSEEVFRIPVLGVVKKVSGIQSQKLTILSTSSADADGAVVELNIKNNTQQTGQVFLMNLIGLDERKKDNDYDDLRSKGCDLESVGYSVLDGKIYFGFKLYQQVTTWHLCELGVQIDADDDGIADQELVGVPLDRLPGMPEKDEFSSVLLDAREARNIRKKFESVLDSEKKSKPDYQSAVRDVQKMMNFEQSSIAIISEDLDKIKKSPTGELKVKFLTTTMEEYSLEGDDYLGSDEADWRKLDVSTLGQGYIFDRLSENLNPQESSLIKFQKGQGSSSLLLLTPTNRSVLNSLVSDEEMEIVTPKYLKE